MDQRAMVVSLQGSAGTSAARRSVKCPGCENLVAPRTPVCPSCNYSLAKLHNRLQWCNVLFAGILGAGVAAILMVLGSHGALHGWFGWSVIILGIGGILATLSGMLGILTGWPCLLARLIMDSRSSQGKPPTDEP